MPLPGTSIRLKADLALFFVSIIWGTAFIAQSVAGEYRLAYLFNAASFGLAVIILLPFIPNKRALPAGQWRWMILAGVILFVASALQQVGVIYTKVANAGFLTSLYVVFTPFLLWFGFREKPHWIDLAAVLAACLGAYLLSTAGQGLQFQRGDILEIVGALFWGLHVIVIGKFASRFESISFAAGQFFIAALLNLAVGLFVEDLQTLSILPVLGAVLYRALFSIGIGYTLQVWGQNHTPPTDTALILSLESVFAALAGWLVLGQTLLAAQIFGCGLIFAAVMFSQRKGQAH